MTTVPDVCWLCEFTLVLGAAEPTGVEAVFPAGLRTLLGVVLGVYLLLMLGISLYAKGRVETEEDFLVAGRKLGLFLAWTSLFATWFGAAAMSGVAGAAREGGLRAVILDPFACSATLIVTGLFFAAPLWRLKLLTIGDFFRETYGRTAEVLGSLLIVPAFFGWIAAQFRALGLMQEVYFELPLGWGILIAFVLTLVYTSAGGMWSVTLTDTLMVVVSLAGLIVLADATFSAFGGGSAAGGLNRMLAELPGDALNPLPPPATGAILGWTGTVCAGLLGCIPGQDLLQRVFAARSSRTAVGMCLLTGVTYLAFGMIPVAIGLVSSLTDPQYATGDQDRVLQYMAGKYLSPGLTIVFALAFVSLVMSSACSAVLAPATVLGHNLVAKLPLFRGRGLLVERLCVLLVSLGSLALAVSGASIMELLSLNLALLLSGLFVPLAMGLYGRPRSGWSGILAMIAGPSAYLLRRAWEEVVWPIPAAIELPLPYYDWFSRDAGRMAGSSAVENLAWLATVMPAELYGLGGSVCGYVAGQLTSRGGSPLNTGIRQRAFGAAAETTATPRT